MNILLKKEVEEPQPAIDTICDTCGAIYDLLDCTTSVSGKVLCPDCSGENNIRNSPTLVRSLPHMKKYTPQRKGIITGNIRHDITS